MISSVYSSFTKLASPNRGLNQMFGICRCFPIPESFLSSVTQSIAFIFRQVYSDWLSLPSAPVS